MAHHNSHAPAWYAAKVKKDILISLGVAVAGGSIFRYWHKQIFVPTVQDYYTKYEDATLQKLEASALQQATWETNELPLIRSHLNRTFESIWTSENVDDIAAGTYQDEE